MSLRSLISATNIAFLLGGVYFTSLAGLHESTVYSVVPALLCFVAFGLGVQTQWFLSGPWRTATAVLVVMLTVVQEAANLSLATASDYYTLGSTLINGVVLIVFLGVLLSTLKNVVREEEQEEEESGGKTVHKQAAVQK